MAIHLFRFDLLHITALVLTALHLLISVSCLQKSPLPTPQGPLMDEKARLGSTPPSCHNRCNECNPCMAVQVPTLPSHERVDPGLGNPIPTMDDSLLPDNKYTNYKPLGWKCQCGDRLFNP